MKTMLRIALPVLALAILASQSKGGVINTFYGDNDGFGIGATSGSIDPTASHAGAEDHGNTDTRLIGNGYAAPAFAPTDSFDSFSLGGQTITSVVLTARMGGFVNISPVDGSNILMINSTAIPTSFFGEFATTGNGFVDLETISLPSTFYAGLTGGVANLSGTHISQGNGYGSFQVDFLELTITTAESVPEPATMLLTGTALIGLALVRLRKK